MRRPQQVAGPGAAFGFAVRSEPEGWTVIGHGEDGRRLGRELKGLSDPAQATLITLPDRATNSQQLRRLASAWVAACHDGVTNADVLISFADASAGRNLGDDLGRRAAPGAS